MLNLNDLYCMTTGHITTPNISDGECEYHGQIVLGGPDAAVEIKHGRVNLYIDGTPTANPHFIAFVAKHEETLIKVCGTLRRDPGDFVVLAGKWHHVEYDHAPLFSPYIIHVVSADGAKQSFPYDMTLFGTDDYVQSGGAFGVVIPCTHPDDVEEALRCSTECHFSRYPQFFTGSGHSVFAGILWRPANEQRSAVYTTFSNECEEQRRMQIECGPHSTSFAAFRAALDQAAGSRTVTQTLQESYRVLTTSLNTATAEVRHDGLCRVTEILANTAFGILGGEVVKRTPFPQADTVTLEDIERSTTIPGYWFQIRNVNGDIHEPTFQAFGERKDPRDLEPILLHRRDLMTATIECRSCLFASDWQGGNEGYQSRWMAAGPVPTLSW